MREGGRGRSPSSLEPLLVDEDVCDMDSTRPKVSSDAPDCAPESTAHGDSGSSPSPFSGHSDAVGTDHGHFQVPRLMVSRTDGRAPPAQLMSPDSLCSGGPARAPLSRSRKSLRGFTSDLAGLEISFAELAGQVQRAGADGELQWGDESNVPEDVYGVVVVSVVRDFTELLMRRRIGAPLKLCVIRISVALLMMIANLALQIGILTYTRQYIGNASVRAVQERFRRFHAEVFNASGFPDWAKWGDYPEKDAICEIAMSETVFSYTILFLWTLTMLNELRTAQRIFSVVYELPHCVSAGDMLSFQDRIIFEGRCCIVALTTWARLGLYTLVVLPKFLISIFLLHIGSRWLITGSFADMILNSLALGFVIEIDDLLFQTWLCRAQQQQVMNTKFFFAEPEITHLREVDARHLQGFKRTGVYVLLGTSYLFLYMRYLQSVLPPDLSEVRSLCSDFLVQTSEPICSHIGAAPAAAACYPYGGEAQASAREFVGAIASR